MRLLESFTPNLRLARDSERSPNCPTIARPALRSTNGIAGEMPSHAAVAHPANAAQKVPPASPAQVFRGLQRGAKRGPPSIRPIADAPISVAQTTASTHKRVARPIGPSRANQSKLTQGSATHSAPNAVHRGSRSRAVRAVQKTMPAPISAVPSARTGEASAAAATTANATATSTIPVWPNWPRRQSRPHSKAITAAAIAVNSGSQGQPNQIAAIGNGASVTADNTRSCSEPRSVRTNGCTVPAFPAAEFIDCLLQVALREIGPQRLGEEELRIGALPQQKVADAFVAAGADQQIGVGELRRKQMAGEAFLVDRRRGYIAGCNLFRYRLDRSNNLGTPAIGQRNRQGDHRIVARHCLGVLDQVEDVRRQAAEFPDDFQANPAAMQFGYFTMEIVAQQPHQILDFSRRSPPILR